MEAYQQRVVDELEELRAKCKKLALFFTTPQYAALPLPDRALLSEQLEHMERYNNVLVRRIARFK